MTTLAINMQNINALTSHINTVQMQYAEMETKAVREWKVEQLYRKLCARFPEQIVSKVFNGPSNNTLHCATSWDEACRLVEDMVRVAHHNSCRIRHEEVKRKLRLKELERENIVTKIKNIRSELERNPKNHKAVESLTRWENKLVQFDSTVHLLGPTQ